MLCNPLHLGASLYVPATRNDLVPIVKGDKLGHVRSIIFCLEDAISTQEVPMALQNLRSALPAIAAQDNRMFFVRPRHLAVFGQLLQIPGAEKLTGFVVPKATAATLPLYVQLLENASKLSFGKLEHTMLMPTLETADVFDAGQMDSLHTYMRTPEVMRRILMLRIGGNDLFNVLGLRRSRHRTIYESVLGATIAQLVARFKPSGFSLSSPVCEHLYDYEVLEREVSQDIEYGLFAKTAVHPDQVAVIERFFKPSEQDFRMATAILAPDAPAVFNMYGSMCEVATHHRWAQQIHERAHVYGVFGKDSDNSAVTLQHRSGCAQNQSTLVAVA